MVVEGLEAGAWGPGGGLRSPEHWLAWRTGLAQGRTAKIVGIARRVDDLPACIELFRAGRLSEDAMALIARKAPAERDEEIADLAPLMLHSQLARILNHLPDQDPPERPAKVRKTDFGFRDDG